jgi:cyclic pyranopterin phosphate synthase
MTPSRVENRNISASRIWKGVKLKITLQDHEGRVFPYLRLSVTNVCNFRCTYCLPNGYQKTGLEKSELSISEIKRLVTAFAGMGTHKVRLTGGEPTIRKDIMAIGKTISAIDGIEKLAITTNGYKLNSKAKELYNAGVRAINISVDSLDPDKFKTITGHNRFNEVIEGIDKCLELGFENVKINVVLLKDFNDIEFEQFMLLSKMKQIHVRFIELMRTGDNIPFFNEHHLSTEVLANKLIANGWVQKLRSASAGPAIEYIHPEYKGRIGFIAPYSKDFCKSCNRLRVTSQGALQLCLFGDGRHDLRPLLQHDSQINELQDTIQNLLNYKKSHHFLHEENFGITQNLASVGG